MPPGLLVRVVAYWIHRGSNPLDPAILDVTRSRIHKAVMRPSVTYELHSLQSTGVFAEWYGNPGEVGPSPFDYNISPEWQASMRGKEKWAAVFNTSCSASEDSEICDLVKAVRSSPHRTVKRVKLASAIPWSSDIVITSTADDHDKSGSLRIHDSKGLNIRILNECDGPNCVADADFTRTGITLARHAFELLDFFEYKKLQELYGRFDMHLFGHLPYVADPAVYYPLQSWKDKTIDYLDVDTILDDAPTPIMPTAELYREAKLCLFSSTPKKRMSREWVKAMLSGCVIVSDLPTEAEEILAEAIVAYEQPATATNMRKVVEQLLEDEMFLQKKALRAFIHARRYHTPAYQAGYILQLIDLHRSGERGYDFPMPFSAVCRVYPDGTKPSWC